MNRFSGSLLLIASLLWLQNLHSQNTIPNLREWTVTVTNDSGQPVRGLQMEDFRVEEGGMPQPIQRFSRDPDIPVSLGLLIDANPGPSSFGILAQELGAVRIFLRSFAKQGDDFVVTTTAHFDSRKPSGDVSTIDHALLAFYPTELSQKLVNEHLSSQKFEFGEDMVRAMEETKKMTHRRKGLIVSASQGWGLELDKTIGKIRDEEIPAYILLFRIDTTTDRGSVAPPLSLEALKNAGNLTLESQFSKIAQETGGQTESFTFDQSRPVLRIETFAQRVSGELRGQYQISYAAANTIRGILNSTRILLPRFPQYHVRFRPVVD